MSHVLAIDPGNTESAYALIDADRRPLRIDKIPNAELLQRLPLFHVDLVAIEMVASYGMAVGKDVFETCVWIGRFQQFLISHAPRVPVDLVYRREVKLHHCASAKAKDSNISQALIDRFASGQPNRGKGTKADPGWFYGFRADIWQAYALAVLVADTTPTFAVPATTSTPAAGTAPSEQGALL
jgi:hypothetical protein